MWLPWIFILSTLTILMVVGLVVSEIWTAVVLAQEVDVLEPQVPTGSLAEKIQEDCIRHPAITRDFRTYLIYLDKTLAWSRIPALEELRSWQYWHRYIRVPNV